MKGDCEGCKKPATVHLTEISGGKKIEKHYCETCPKLQGEQVVAKPHQPINELLTNFVLAHSGIGQEQTAACESCGITWAEFKQAGLLGCENDYQLFEKELTPIIQRAHEGATHHTGKVPTRRAGGTLAKSKRPDLSRLRKQLADAVEREDYELAAKLRDQIKQVENG
ncbi:MAG: UvrB/UvrC motif-containing protein [Tepidisphaeraceae bacterium]